MTTQNEDPIVKAIEGLPEGPISEKLARDVARKARIVLEAESHVWLRFDRLFMDRLMPATLGLALVGYAVNLVEFYGRVYVG